MVLFTLPFGAMWAQGPYPFQDSRLREADRIADLLKRMTLEEKIDALGTNPTVPRLGVIGTQQVEGLHGLALGGSGGWEGRNQTVIPTTQFPQSRGLGQTWDAELLQQAAAVEAFETDYAFNHYHRGGRVVRVPNADLSRDPRWGRSEESYGEDPFLTGTLATAFTKGLQESQAATGGSHYWATSSLLKHFLANSSEDGRGGSSSNFDDRLFHEYFAVPFRMAIEQGHADAMMTSYNAWNGIPMAANPVLRAVVMKQWGFDGILCTDAGALTGMVKEHHYYADIAHASAGALHAGINQFLDSYKDPVREALAQKLVTESDIDQNLRGVFHVMLRLGMLNAVAQVPPAQVGLEVKPGDDPWWSAASRALARKVTDESVVLLKNENATLPLRSPRSIAVIGRLADRVALDWYSGTPPFAVTPLAGIRARAHGAEVTYSDGTDASAAAEAARKAEVAIVVVGNHPTCDAGWMKCALPSEGKEAIDRKSLTLEEETLVKAVFAANPKTIVVLHVSFPYTTTWTEEHVPAILEMAHNSEEQGDGLADVLFGDYNPAGRLTQTWVSSIDQLPALMDYDIRHGRTYLYASGKPLYAFGHGLSYTKFGYSNLRVSPEQMRAGEDVQVSADVTNEGTCDGDEVVQLYVAHQGSAVSRPLEELKGFRRVRIGAGKTVTVSMTLHAADLAYWNAASNGWTLEKDRVELRLGAASNDIRLRRQIAVDPQGKTQ
jgi:beta-glucosidase